MVAESAWRRARRWSRAFSVLLVLVVSARAPAQSRQELVEARNRMVDQEIVAAGVTDPRVVKSMRTTPRHEFVSLNRRSYAYYDMSLPILTTTS